MENESQNEKLIVQYLLGDLPEEELVRVEDRAFSDKEYLQRVLAVESDLIDEYVRGKLPDRESRQFESRFLVSSERREKVEFALALAKVASEVPATETVRQPAAGLTQTSWWDSFIAILRTLNPAVKVSLAVASVVLLIGISWLLAQTIMMREELARFRAEQQAQYKQQDTLKQHVADERARIEKLAAQLEHEKEQRKNAEELARQLEQGLAKTVPQTPIASLILLPGISRSSANRPKLVISRGSRLARLQLGLEREDEYESFRVELSTAQGQEVWTQGNLRPKESRAGRVVVLSIPTRLLDAAEYELTLKGVSGGQTTDVRYYYFSAVKQ